MEMICFNDNITFSWSKFATIMNCKDILDKIFLLLSIFIHEILKRVASKLTIMSSFVFHILYHKMKRSAIIIIRKITKTTRKNWNVGGGGGGKKPKYVRPHLRPTFLILNFHSFVMCFCGAMRNIKYDDDAKHEQYSNSHHSFSMLSIKILRGQKFKN